jgi:hypothetical protein
MLPCLISSVYFDSVNNSRPQTKASLRSPSMAAQTALRTPTSLIVDPSLYPSFLLPLLWLFHLLVRSRHTCPEHLGASSFVPHLQLAMWFHSLLCQGHLPVILNCLFYHAISIFRSRHGSCQLRVKVLHFAFRIGSEVPFLSHFHTHYPPLHTPFSAIELLYFPQFCEHSLYSTEWPATSLAGRNPTYLLIWGWTLAFSPKTSPKCRSGC